MTKAYMSVQQVLVDDDCTQDTLPTIRVFFMAYTFMFACPFPDAISSKHKLGTPQRATHQGLSYWLQALFVLKTPEELDAQKASDEQHTNRKPHPTGTTT